MRFTHIFSGAIARWESYAFNPTKSFIKLICLTLFSSFLFVACEYENPNGEASTCEPENYELSAFYHDISYTLEGDSLIIEIELNSTNADVEGVYGIDMDLPIHPAIVETSNIEVDFSDSWLVVDEHVKYRVMPNWMLRSLDVVIHRTDCQPKNGTENIVRIVATNLGPGTLSSSRSLLGDGTIVVIENL